MRRVSNLRSSALVCALLMATLAPGTAFARTRRANDRSVDLDAAERALESLRYEEARPLLERAWRSGQNGPVALALLFRLQGEVAATLGDEAAARRAFARWLALAPGAQLDEGTSPKLAAVLEAARAQLGGAALAIDVEVAENGAAVALVVVSDPLDMIAGARASYRDESGVQGVVEGKGDHRVELPLPVAGHFRVVVAAVDSYGNRLVDHEITVVPAPASAKPSPPPPPPTIVATPAPPLRPLVASPWLWAGLGSASLIVGGVFAWRAGDAQHELDTLDAESGQHSFGEARAVEDRLVTSAVTADLAFAAAGACAIAAIVLALEPRPGTASHLGIGPTAHGGRVALEWHF
jgi:hypothetical protein